MFSSGLYRYGSALFFGCSIVVRNDVLRGTTGVGQNATGERVLYLSCVFAAKRKLYTTVGRMTNKTCAATDKRGYAEAIWEGNPTLCLGV